VHRQELLAGSIEAQSYNPTEEEQKRNPAQLPEDSTHMGLRAGINTTA
jgi:hypothetical protein